jgi:hypothetical protein
MLAVQLESSAGEKLQIATGSTAKLTSPIPTSLRGSAPATISLWYVDEQTGIWKEEGTAIKTGNNYVGTVKHFSFWNCDMPINAIILSLTLRNNEGGPLVHVPVRITRTVAGVFSQAYGYTDSTGSVSGMVPSNENLVLEVLDPCQNSIYSQNIGPFTQNTNVGIITVTDPGGTSLVTVTGQLRNCSGAIVTNGYAIISFDNGFRYVNVNSNGQFSFSFTRCAASTSTLDVTGVDNGTQQQATVTNIAVTSPVTNTGIITACGVSSAQYFNYTLDGTNYSISTGVVPDSLMGYTYPLNAQPAYLTALSGFSITTNNNHISLWFTSPGTAAPTAGTYQANSLSVQQFANSVPIQPFNVIVTSFPANPGAFYEGTFSGQFRDSLNMTTPHTINGAFRLRRS